MSVAHRGTAPRLMVDEHRNMERLAAIRPRDVRLLSREGCIGEPSRTCNERVLSVLAHPRDVVTLECNNRQYRLSPLGVLVVPTSCTFVPYSGEENANGVVHLTFLFSEPHGIDNAFILEDHDLHLKWVLDELASAELSETRVLGVLTDLLFDCLRLLIVRSNSEPTAFDRAVAFVSSNYDKPFTVSELARFAGVTPTYLNRVIKRATGLTPVAYVNRVRIEAARKLLLTRGESVSSVCAKVGIEDPKYFSRLFKKVTGVAPTEHLRRASRAAAVPS